MKKRTAELIIAEYTSSDAGAYSERRRKFLKGLKISAPVLIHWFMLWSRKYLHLNDVRMVQSSTGELSFETIG